MHYDCSSEEVLKMASGSSEAGGFTCCVPGCYNNSEKHKGKFSFYNLPGDQNLRRQWLHNISRKDFRPTTGHRVSGAHLEGGSKTYQNDVPTVFHLQKSHPEVIKTPRRLLARHKEEEIQEDPRCSGGSSVFNFPKFGYYYSCTSIFKPLCIFRLTPCLYLISAISFPVILSFPTKSVHTFLKFSSFIS